MNVYIIKAGFKSPLSAIYETALVWFCRDLRNFDHAALHAALSTAKNVYCLFVFDTDILDALSERQDRRIDFILESVNELHQALELEGGGLGIVLGSARSEVVRIAVTVCADVVYAASDYEPFTIDRDKAVASSLQGYGKKLILLKDQVIFEKHEILTDGGMPYRVFSYYKKAWLKKLEGCSVESYPVENLSGRMMKPEFGIRPELKDLGFYPSKNGNDAIPPGMKGGKVLLDRFCDRIGQYHLLRDQPAYDGVSYLSAHLRFGTVSIRQLVRLCQDMKTDGAMAFLSELIWRDFFFMILAQFPFVSSQSFRPDCRNLNWSNSVGFFERWKYGNTGYPIVDAGMRQLNETGYMHNRLRMITASFLCKDLHVDWRWGEAYFAARLLDFDLSANNGGWQWSASTGTDAQPYFRIFNPVIQSKKFDSKGHFIRTYVPELLRCPDAYIHAPWTMPLSVQRSVGIVLGRDYSLPVVDHAKERLVSLDMYKNAAGVGQ
ncbi:MAG: deoxyribodipyrimidine photo-lyase [Pseudomonadota bacterium]|nr:deoxyribodipyrimidine photo-lyase [Pseudomonadota bacterium]